MLGFASVKGQSRRYLDWKRLVLGLQASWSMAHRICDGSLRHPGGHLGWHGFRRVTDRGPCNGSWPFWYREITKRFRGHRWGPLAVAKSQPVRPKATRIQLGTLRFNPWDTHGPMIFWVLAATMARRTACRIVGTIWMVRKGTKSGVMKY